MIDSSKSWGNLAFETTYFFHHDGKIKPGKQPSLTNHSGREAGRSPGTVLEKGEVGGLGPWPCTEHAGTALMRSVLDHTYKGNL